MWSSVKLFAQSLAKLYGHCSPRTDPSLGEFKDEEDRALPRLLDSKSSRGDRHANNVFDVFGDKC